MAVLRNRTTNRLSLFRPDAPPIEAGGEVTVRDERVVGRTWPRVTWEFIEPPEGYDDVGPADAYLFTPTPEKPKAKPPAKPKESKS